GGEGEQLFHALVLGDLQRLRHEGTQPQGTAPGQLPVLQAVPELEFFLVGTPAGAVRPDGRPPPGSEQCWTQRPGPQVAYFDATGPDKSRKAAATGHDRRPTCPPYGSRHPTSGCAAIWLASSSLTPSTRSWSGRGRTSPSTTCPRTTSGPSWSRPGGPSTRPPAARGRSSMSRWRPRPPRGPRCVIPSRRWRNCAAWSGWTGTR